MAANVIDVLKINIVFVGIDLLSRPEDIESFRQAVDSEVVEQGVGIVLDAEAGGGATQGAMYTLQKDRITLERSAHRTAVSRDYPARGDLERLASVVSAAIESTSLGNQRPLATGSNIDFVFDQTSDATALQYLGQRIFSNPFSNNGGWELIGGSGRLLFSDGDHRWTISIEPRFKDESTNKVYVSLNSHVTGDHLLSESEVLDFLNRVWDQVDQVVDRINSNV